MSNAEGTNPVPASQPGPDWVRETEHAGWQPRDSAGEVVFQDQLDITDEVIKALNEA